MKITAKEFRSEKNKRLTLLGMSGVGKTHLAKLIGENGGWYHFSGDYHIGATYLKDEIINNIAKKMKQDPWLQNLLDNQSISVNSQVTFDNLEPISAFLGKVGNPQEGGLEIDEFIRRQSLFLEAEIKLCMTFQALSNNPNNQDTTISLTMQAAVCVNWRTKNFTNFWLRTR